MSSSGEDAINVGDFAPSLIFDHVSLEFAGYNNIDATGNNGSDNITVQNSIIGDPMSQWHFGQTGIWRAKYRARGRQIFPGITICG